MAERESIGLWSTTAASNDDIDPSINWLEGQLPSTVNNSSRSQMAALARHYKDTNGSLTTAGSANAYTLTVNATWTAYATGQIIAFKASFANTSTATLNVTNADAVAIGAKAIRGPGDTALAGGEIVSGGRYLLQYDATANSAAGAWLLLNRSGGGTSLSPYVYFITALDDAGASDQSAAIQAQIDACEAAGICEAVFPPYLIWAEGLTISHPLLLRGTGVKVAMGNLDEGLPSDVGTRLIAKTGTNPCIDVLPGANGATITGIQFQQVHAADAPGWTPTVYAPAIRNYSAWTTIEKNSFWGCYDGVRLGKAWADPGSGYVTVINNTFACFHRGVHVYKAADWNLINRNWFQNYFVEDLTNQRAYIQATAEAIFVERADALEITENGVFGHLYGIRTGINADAPTEAEGIAERLKLANNDFDKVRVGILLVKGCTGEAVNINIVGDNVAGSFAIQGNENVQFQFTNTRTINHGVQAILAAQTGCVLKFRNLTVINAALDGATTVFSCAAGATIHRDGGFTATGTYTGVEGGAGSYVTEATLGGTETFTGVKTFGSAGAVGRLKIAGTTSGAITLDATAIAGTGTLTLPAATDTLTGKATTDTLTNKTFDTAGTGNALYINGNQVNNYSGSGLTVLLATNPEIAGALRFEGSTSQVVLLQATAVAGNVTQTLQAVDGTVALTLNLGAIRVVKTAINFNSANTDNAITVSLPPGITRYVVFRIFIGNASASISTATAGVFTGAGATGQTMAATQALTVTATAADTNNNNMAMTGTNANTMAYNDTTIYFRVVNPQGSAATADVTLIIHPLS